MFAAGAGFVVALRVRRPALLSTAVSDAMAWWPPQHAGTSSLEQHTVIRALIERSRGLLGADIAHSKPAPRHGRRQYVLASPDVRDTAFLARLKEAAAGRALLLGCGLTARNPKSAVVLPTFSVIAFGAAFMGGKCSF